MKRAYVQAYRVTLNDGTTRDVCCGPAVAALPDVYAYRAVGGERDGVCCHHDGIVRSEVLRAERQAHEVNEVYAALAPWAYRQATTTAAGQGGRR